MAKIRKRIWPEYFELVKAGKKRFEVRVADFDVEEGDTLILEEWNPKTKKYTAEKLIDDAVKLSTDPEQKVIRSVSIVILLNFLGSLIKNIGSPRKISL